MSKVTRASVPPKFEPITIVLETEQEAATVWHRLNCNKDLDLYCKERGILKQSIEAGNLWEKLDEVYYPKERIS